MLKHLFAIFEGKHYRFIFVGLLVFGLNLLIANAVFQIEFFKTGFWNQNLGNFIALELALLLSFPLHKFITWLEGWENFIPKLIKFHIVSFIGVSFRIVVFGALTYLGFDWLISSVISIGFVVLINFVGFDQFVFFEEQKKLNENHLVYSSEGDGIDTLETIEDAKTYNRWIAEKIIDYLGERNLELGAGTGTIASIVSEVFPIEIYDLSKENIKILKDRFEKNPNIVKIGEDVLSIKDSNQYDCIYSSNVMEHIPEDTKVLNHCLKLLKRGGFFVAIVPAMPILYSAFDKKIGHFRRYSKTDLKRWNDSIDKDLTVRWVDSSYFNPIGAVGWLVKMKLLKQQKVKKRDAMIMNSLIPFIAWLDYLPLPFGQSMIMVLKKL